MARNTLKTKFGFIFDLDGTLIDSASQIARAVNKTLDTHGYPLRADGEIFKEIGLPASALFAYLDLTELENTEIISEFRLHLAAEINQSNVVFEDALLFVQKLKDDSQFVAVATSKPTDLATSVINNSAYRNLVDFTVGTGKQKPKPDPGMIIEILAKFGLNHGVMFGDRPEDVTAALSAGISAVGIAQSTFSTVELISFGANRAFNNFSELMIDYEESGDDIIDYFK